MVVMLRNRGMPMNDYIEHVLAAYNWLVRKSMHIATTVSIYDHDRQGNPIVYGFDFTGASEELLTEFKLRWL